MSLEKPQTAKIDINNPAVRTTHLFFVRGDKNVYPLTINLRDKERRFEIPEGVSFWLEFAPPKGSSFKGREAGIVNATKGELLYNISEAEIAVPGQYTVSVTGYTSTQKLTFQKFTFDVIEPISPLYNKPPDVYEVWVDAINEKLAGIDARIKEIEENDSERAEVYRKDFAASEWAAYLTGLYQLIIPATAHLRGIKASVIDIWRNGAEYGESVNVSSRRYVNGNIALISNKPFSGQISIV